MTMKINVYVDGFNLYYGAVKNTPYKWLDIHKMCSFMFPKDNINRIRYFTALVNPTPNDMGMRDRQLAYIRALQTIPCLTVAKGIFRTNNRWMPLVTPLSDGTRFVEVLYTEEKGSDVNLATYLVFDGCQSDYEGAVIISNDTDLVEAISLVRNILECPVHVVSPHGRRTWPLINIASTYRYIRGGVKAASQFPSVINDKYGVIKKPISW